MNKIINYFYGILLCIFIALGAQFLSNFIAIGTISISIILGILVGNFLNLTNVFDLGITFSEKHILSLAIIFLGVKLDYLILSKLGLKVIFIVVIGIVITISISLLLGKLFKINKKFVLLLGIGNAICGSSAIATTQNIIGGKKEEIGLSITIVNFYGTIGLLVLPFLGSQILNFTDIKMGVLIGNTLQSVGQVVATGFSINDSIGQTATIVKMSRILMLIPLMLSLLYISSKSKNNTPQSKFKGIPIFIIGFILFSLIPTFKLLSIDSINFIRNLSNYLLIIAMAGIGLKIKFRNMRLNGKSALMVGGITFITQIIISNILVNYLL